MAIDEELNMVYLPVETPTNDYYGGARPGNNLFAESLVALDLKTGQRKWHFQIVHHPLWDFDLSSAPILADITVNGRAIKAVALPSKQSFLYVFDRVTGQPVWPIEERPVPKGDVPGEWYSPTQPYPTKPPAYSRQNLTIDELIDFTPELRAKARADLVEVRAREAVRSAGAQQAGRTDTRSLTFATALGGTNWPGGSYDPETHTVYRIGQPAGGRSRSAAGHRSSGFRRRRTLAATLLAGLRDVQGHSGDGPRLNGGAPAGIPVAPGNPSPPPGMGAGFLRLPTVDGLPINKPPYGVISAINLDRGELVWQVPHGDTPDAVRNHPALKGINIPTNRPADQRRHDRDEGAGHCRRAERSRRLVIRAARCLRAYDKRTGKDAGQC